MKERGKGTLVFFDKPQIIVSALKVLCQDNKLKWRKVECHLMFSVIPKGQNWSRKKKNTLDSILEELASNIDFEPKEKSGMCHMG